MLPLSLQSSPRRSTQRSSSQRLEGAPSSGLSASATSSTGALADGLLPLVKERAHSARLARSSPGKGAARIQRWKLAANVSVEAEP